MCVNLKNCATFTTDSKYKDWDVYEVPGWKKSNYPSYVVRDANSAFNEAKILSYCKGEGSIAQNVPGCGVLCSNNRGGRYSFEPTVVNQKCSFCPAARWSSCDGAIEDMRDRCVAYCKDEAQCSHCMRICPEYGGKGGRYSHQTCKFMAINQCVTLKGRVSKYRTAGLPYDVMAKQISGSQYFVANSVYNNRNGWHRLNLALVKNVYDRYVYPNFCPEGSRRIKTEDECRNAAREVTPSTIWPGILKRPLQVLNDANSEYPGGCSITSNEHAAVWNRATNHRGRGIFSKFAMICSTELTVRVDPNDVARGTKKENNPWEVCAEENEICNCAGTVVFARKYEGNNAGARRFPTGPKDTKRRTNTALYASWYRWGINNDGNGYIDGNIKCDVPTFQKDPAKGQKKWCLCLPRQPPSATKPDVCNKPAPPKDYFMFRAWNFKKRRNGRITDYTVNADMLVGALRSSFDKKFGQVQMARCEAKSELNKYHGCHKVYDGIPHYAPIVGAPARESSNSRAGVVAQVNPPEGAWASIGINGGVNNWIKLWFTAKTKVTSFFYQNSKRGHRNKKLQLEFSSNSKLSVTVANDDEMHEYSIAPFTTAEWVKIITESVYSSGKNGAREIGFGCGRVPIKSCATSSQDGNGYGCEKVYDFSMASNTGSWAAKRGEVPQSWIKLDFDKEYTIVGMKFANRQSADRTKEVLLSYGGPLSAETVALHNDDYSHAYKLKAVTVSSVTITVTSTYSTRNNGAREISFIQQGACPGRVKPSTNLADRNKCPAGSRDVPTEDECLVAADVALFADRKPARTLQADYWPNVPSGCTIQQVSNKGSSNAKQWKRQITKQRDYNNRAWSNNGDWTAHWNKRRPIRLPVIQLVKQNADCKSAGQVNLGSFSSIELCAARCKQEGCTYFIYGHSGNAKRCYQEKVSSDDCGPGGFQTSTYHFYKLRSRKRIETKSPLVMEKIKGTQGIHLIAEDSISKCTGDRQPVDLGNMNSLAVCAYKCGQRPSCEHFSFGTGAYSGQCRMEYANDECSADSEALEFRVSNVAQGRNLYRITKPQADMEVRGWNSDIMGGGTLKDMYFKDDGNGDLFGYSRVCEGKCASEHALSAQSAMCIHWCVRVRKGKGASPLRAVGSPL